MTLPTGCFLPLSRLVTLVLCGWTFVSTAPAQDRGELHRYHLEFSLVLPEGWTPRQDVSGAALVALSPLSGQGNRFRENLNVSVESIPEGRSLAEVYRRDFAAIRDGLTAFEAVKTERVTVGLLDARRVVYEHTYNGQRLRALAYLVLADGRCFTLTGTAPVDRFMAVQSAFERMVHSFRPE